MASASPSFRATKHKVFLSFRGEDTRYSFTDHLLKALKDTGIDVSFDIKEKVEKKEEIPQALSDEIEASNLSIIVLSKGYASSKSCLAELSVIMDRKRTQGHAVLPIFYHVDPSHVPNIDGRFGTSSERHKSKKWPDDALKQWNSAFAEVSKLKGWHIEGGKFDRPETEHIKDIVESVKQKLVMKHQVFLSFGEDTRRNFTSHLLKALKDKGISVFFDEEKVENGGQLSSALSQAIATSNLSIVVLSKDYASSKSCLAELSDIMDRKSNHGQIVLPVFYHVDPSDVQHIRLSFKTSFDDHESKRIHVQQWKDAFAEVGKLKGWPIGGKFNRPETEYVKEIVEYVTVELTNSNSISSYKELVGVFDWKKTISSVIGKTSTTFDAIYEEVSPKFEDPHSLKNVSGKKESQGRESSMASSSSSPTKFHVFLSFRGEDTRLNFTSHLFEALKEIGVSVFFDEKKLERGEGLSPAVSQAIAASRLSIIVLSSDYASSKSCLAELSDIMVFKSSYGHIVLPIFYHVDPSHVQNIGGNFKKSFEEHESKSPIHEVKRWKAAFAQVSKLKWWHIKGDKFDRPETEHIKNIVDYVTHILMKHRVFLSFRDEDNGLNFTAHLLKALEDNGITVFSNKGDQFSEAVAASNLSIIVLSADYASSKSCLAELFDIMDRKDNLGQTVLPVFYHVDPSHVLNVGGSFKASFDDHESKGLQGVQQWKKAFARVGTLKGWHIQGGKFDRADTEYIKDVVEYVIKKLNSKSRSVSEELVGLDDQKKVILQLIEKEESRVIGLWGMGGIGKTTLADAVYNEISPKFQSRCFLRNVREKIKNKGMESVRNKLLSKLLNSKIEIDTPTIDSSLIQERLNNIRAIVVLDDVDDPDQINLMGVKFFGDGSKIIATSRDRQVLKNGGADNNIHDVKGLNETDSLQLFSTFAFKLLNPAVDFRDLSSKFVEYAEGNPLALKVLGSKLYTKSMKEWVSEVDRLKQYVDPKISQILMSNFGGLNELEKKIFLDIACFFKGQSKNEVEQILSCTYKDAVSGISNLLCKCLIDITAYGQISMHYALEEMGKDIICQESKYPGERSRLWIPRDVYQVLKYNKGTELIEGIKLDMSQIDNLQLRPSVFKNMINLTYIHFYVPHGLWYKWNPKLLANGVDIDHLSNELRCLWWEYYPFKSLPTSFNPKNLVLLKLCHGKMEQLWNEDDHMDIINLMEIDVSHSKNLRKIPNLLGAANLKTLDCTGCEILFELPCLNHLTSLETLELSHCKTLRNIPDLLGAINLKSLDCKECKSLVELPCLSHLTSLETLKLSYCKNLRKIPDLLGAINLKSLDCKGCESLVELPCLNHLTSLEDLVLAECPIVKKFSEISNNLSELDISCTKIEEVPDSIELLLRLKSLNLRNSEVKNISSNISKLESLQKLGVSQCEGLKSLPELPPYLCRLEAENCTSLERVEFTNHNLYESDSLCNKLVFLSFLDCLVLNQDSIKNIETNAMLQIQYLAQRLVRDVMNQRKSKFHGFICSFPGNEISAEEFEHRGTESRLNLKIAPNGRSGSRFLTFAVCLVTDHTDFRDLELNCKFLLTAASGEELSLEFNCKFLLTVASGEELRSESVFSKPRSSRESDNVFILFGEDMIVKDSDYEEASFDFSIDECLLGGKDVVKVKKWGVHVFYVDAEGYVVSAPTKMMNFSYIGGGGGERGAKRLKSFHST